MRLMGFWVLFVVLRKWGVESFELDGDLSESSSNTTSFWESMSMLESVYGISGEAVPVDALMVKLTLIERAAAMGAVCLDGSSPGYHLHRGSGEGANNWLIQLEGGGWCNSISACKFRKTTRLGSSRYFQKKTPFIGILSNKAYENPDFYNWNRVKVRYCDGGSFAGNSENRAEKLKFRGKLIWEAAMKELMLKGMKNASQALLSGCSAGGLASILHCDKFRSLFHRTTTVKCLSDAGLFLDAGDVSGGHTLRRLFDGVVRLQNVRKRLSGSCPKNLGRTSCFFPQNLIANIKTPLFMLNAAYDSWQIKQSLTPSSADREGKWQGCRNNYTQCTQSQIKFLHGFRSQMVNATKDFAESKQNGLFLNSCFSHGQSERQDTWYAANSPTIDNRSIAKAVGDWYFDRTSVMCIGCEACNETCRNLVFK